jgi:hypothetical protein
MVSAVEPAPSNQRLTASIEQRRDTLNYQLAIFPIIPDQNNLPQLFTLPNLLYKF